MRLAGKHAVSMIAILILTAGWASAGTIEGRVQLPDSKRDRSDFVISVDDLQGPLPSSDRVVIMDQRGLQFVPHVLPIEAGTIVEFANSDPLAHNVFSISSPKRFNLGLYKRGTVRRVKFDQPGVVQLLCNVHQEMSAFVVVLKNPYFARSAADGSFRIEGVPAGNHRLRCWHEAMAEHTYEIHVPATGVVKTTLAVD